MFAPSTQFTYGTFYSKEKSTCITIFGNLAKDTTSEIITWETYYDELTGQTIPIDLKYQVYNKDSKILFTNYAEFQLTLNLIK